MAVGLSCWFVRITTDNECATRATVESPLPSWTWVRELPLDIEACGASPANHRTNWTTTSLQINSPKLSANQTFRISWRDRLSISIRGAVFNRCLSVTVCIAAAAAWVLRDGVAGHYIKHWVGLMCCGCGGAGVTLWHCGGEVLCRCPGRPREEVLWAPGQVPHHGHCWAISINLSLT